MNRANGDPDEPAAPRRLPPLEPDAETVRREAVLAGALFRLSPADADDVARRGLRSLAAATRRAALALPSHGNPSPPGSPRVEGSGDDPVATHPPAPRAKR